MSVLVARCDSGPPAVPSVIVQCVGCGADCYLSKYSGASILAAAALMGDARIFCQPCLIKEAAISKFRACATAPNGTGAACLCDYDCVNYHLRSFGIGDV